MNGSSFCSSAPCLAGDCVDTEGESFCFCFENRTGVFCESVLKLLTDGPEFNNTEYFDDELQRTAQAVVGSVIVTVIHVFVAFFIVLRFHDNEDHIRWKVAPVAGNMTSHKGHYEVHIYTGSQSEAWTDASVSLNMFGSIQDMGSRVLTSYKKLVFNRGTIRAFYLTTRERLGDINSVSVHAERTIINKTVKKWYLKYLVVLDLDTLMWYPFTYRRWVLYEHPASGDHSSDYNKQALPEWDENISFCNNFIAVMFESHLLYSAFVRRVKSPFTRVQRLCCNLFIWSGILLANAVWIEVAMAEGRKEIQLGTLAIPDCFVYCMPLSAILVVFLAEIVVNMFYKAKLSDGDLNQRFMSMASPEKFQHFLTLPHYSAKIAHAVIALMSMVSFITCYVMSLSWTTDTSDVWFVAVALGIATEHLVLQMLKVAVIAFVKTFVSKDDAALDFYRRFFPDAIATTFLPNDSVY